MEAAVFRDLRTARAAFRLGRLKYRCAACGGAHWSGNGGKCVKLMFEASGFFFLRARKKPLGGAFLPMRFLHEGAVFELLRDSFRLSRMAKLLGRILYSDARWKPLKAAFLRDETGEGFSSERQYFLDDLEPWLALEPGVAVRALVRARAHYWRPGEVRARVMALRAVAREFFSSICANYSELPVVVDFWERYREGGRLARTGVAGLHAAADGMIAEWKNRLPEEVGKKRAVGVWVGRAAAVAISPFGYLVRWYAGPAAWFWRHVLTPEDMEVLTGGPPDREFWQREMARPVGGPGLV